METAKRYFDFKPLPKETRFALSIYTGNIMYLPEETEEFFKYFSNVTGRQAVNALDMLNTSLVELARNAVLNDIKQLRGDNISGSVFEALPQDVRFVISLYTGLQMFLTEEENDYQKFAIDLAGKELKGELSLVDSCKWNLARAKIKNDYLSLFLTQEQLEEGLKIQQSCFDELINEETEIIPPEDLLRFLKDET